MVKPYNLADLKAHFPSHRDPDPAVFEVAVACCGGTSTGPYVAGVMDFLWEAFEEWRDAAVLGQAPRHKVRIRNLVGTSAGGLSVGLAALTAIKQFPHVYDDRLWAKYHADDPGSVPAEQPKDENPAYSAWVRQVTLQGLLSNAKEVETGQIHLFHNVPKEICEVILAMADRAPFANGRDWIYDPLELRGTIGNLEGVPYALDFNHVAGGAGVADQWFKQHRDQVAFAFETGGVGGIPNGLGPAPDAYVLPLSAFRDPPTNPDERGKFQATMTSTSAIPVVFEVQPVPQDPLVYCWRGAYWDVERKTAIVDQPVWQPGQPQNPLNFDATDGGLFDDKPFDIAHQRLAGMKGHNPQDAKDACRAVILVDPLANDSGPRVANPDEKNIFDVIARLIYSPVDQDRLDVFDLAQIKDETIFSRFMISPSREGPTTGKAWPPSLSLLGAPLDAFLGFAAEAYRAHDFLLGRRNAQRFLQTCFMLPKDNPLVSDDAGWLASEEVEVGGVVYRPIIPLRGRAADVQPLPDWNWQALTNDQIDLYVKLAGKRADAIFHNLKTSTASGLAGAFVKLYLNIGWVFGGRSMVLDAFRNALNAGRDGLDPAKRP
jgi:hypothetical protein